MDAWNINLNRYSEVVDQIKETKRERTDLLAEKKELPFWNIPRKNELTARIAELTELLEELQSEKAILLDNMDCTEGKDVSKVRKKVALMEANLKELDEQEQKYSAELETALAEYAELKTQGEQFDPVELHDTRQELRPEMEQTAVQRVKESMAISTVTGQWMTASGMFPGIWTSMPRARKSGKSSGNGNTSSGGRIRPNKKEKAG